MSFIMNKSNLVIGELIRYSQQIKMDEIGLAGQEKLKNSRVLCIGLGGLGSPLLLYLAAAGVGVLGIVDDDIIELSNLHRQILYNHTHINKKKVAAAKEQLLAINPLIQIESYSRRLTEENAAELISQYDIIADGSDNFYTRYLIHSICFELEKPYVYASASHFQGYCSIFHGKQDPCFHCVFPVSINDTNMPSCEGSGVIGTLPGMLGIIQATEVIKWILQIGNPLKKRLLAINMLTMTFKDIIISKNPDCEFCIQNQPIKQLINPINCPTQNDPSHHRITLDEFYKLFTGRNNIQLIDVRSTKEHQIQNIGGLVLPLDELPQRLHELNPNQAVILYCQSGRRSKMALDILLKFGFASVKYLENGLKGITAD
ncbi:TPA: thiamine biosynthesis protein ThiF [Legionella pneumophila]|nr:thiamine biosynthesis protein ThiF [Legionella pneumophila]HAT8357467.1 thiamine biosynthesis protein ThiF [Legionella pneumophila]HAU1195554.1 thiamine biosynthesis protein ThiF [Legionella pneumophila]HAU1206839.1 thiamine biosynthesis protein ThiF [Legionella pneumophila]HAU1283649.1 thiamine biosynthesis protein ThiF [Legionella pneumophila]